MKVKKKKRDVLAGKRDPVSQLYRAVRRYVEHNKGSILVIGGIQMMDYSAEERARGKFNIVINCLGKRPSFAGRDT